MVESPEAKAVEDEAKLPVGDPDYMEFMESRKGEPGLGEVGEQ